MNDPSTPPATAANDPAVPSDPVAALDELIAKAKAKRASITQASADPSNPDQAAMAAAMANPQVPAGPTPEEIQAQKMQELAIKEAAAAEENQRLLQDQQQKMQTLAETPQYQARKAQDEETAKQQAEQQAAQQGHVIHQIGDAKV